jgi:hypothetical protein
MLRHTKLTPVGARGNTPFCAVCPLDRTAGRSVANFCARDRSSGPVGSIRPDLWLSDIWQLVINTGTTIVTFLMNGTRPAETMHPGRIFGLSGTHPPSIGLID